MNAQTLRYHLPKKTIKGNCPDCSPRHRRTLSRYVDTQTGEPLPEHFGRCDRENNCGYHVSPYHKGLSGMSYADEVFEQWKANNPLPPRAASRRHISHATDTDNRPKTRFSTSPKPPQTVSSTPSPPEPIYTIPDEVLKRTIGHYECNPFAQLLWGHFGQESADDLLQRFQIGTCRKPSGRWPQEFATVFWLIDGQGRARSGQVVLFIDNWHKATYTDREGNIKVCISSVSHGLLRHYHSKAEDVPDWLTTYHRNAPRWPFPFGLHQLRHAAEQHPVAIVEAPKTAVLCTGYFPDFTWLAIGAKSYPNADRLAELKGRKIRLFPDLHAYDDWSRRADALRAEGFTVDTSRLILDLAGRVPADEWEELPKDPDLADFLLWLHKRPPQPRVVTTLAEWQPGTILRPKPSQIEYI